MPLVELGAYPSDPYYDPNRPSWLPYWIDSFTEFAAKLSLWYGKGDVSNLRDVPPSVDLPAPAAPQTEQEMYSWTPEQMQRATVELTRQELSQAGDEYLENEAFWQALNQQQKEELQRRVNLGITTASVITFALAGLTAYVAYKVLFGPAKKRVVGRLLEEF